MTVDEILATYLETGSLDVEAVDGLDAADRSLVHSAIANLERARVTLADPEAWAEPDPDLEARVLAAVLSTEDRADRSNEDRAADPVVVSIADVRVRRSRWAAVGAAVIAVAAIVVAVVAFAGRNPSSDPRTSGTEFALAGTGLLPDASGQVRLEDTSSGMRVYLDAKGLPRRDNGEFYEAWAKTAHGLVPIGTFHTGVDVTLWSGVSMADVDAITVSLEQNDGNQETSGQRVMVARVR